MRPPALALSLLLAVLTSATGCATLVLTGGVEAQAPPPSATSLESQVREALRGDAGLSAAGIDVSVQGDEVTLAGQVPTRAQADRAAGLALSVDGVSRIINKLSIAPGR